MPIAPGTKLGPYQVVSLLGTGGMGEVYAARDARLGREVALKLLPEAFAGDPERLSRFEREAQVLAALNHPNIAQIYALEAFDLAGGKEPRRLTLVMERVEGPSLAERLARGPLPLDEAVSIARQIAEALEAAHERGIVHRDLKPGNVKVTPEGAAKVLDFGLARVLAPDSGSEASLSGAADSPTLTSYPTTAAGVILGTAAYMAPEQAKGKAVDRRADIWAFGCVLAEMLSGKPLYTGETVSDVLAAVILKEPDLGGLPAEVPYPLRRLLARCLDKDPKRRLRDIGEARVLLERPLRIEPADAQRESPASSRPFGAMGGWVLAILIVAALAAAAGWYARPLPEPRLSKSHVALQVNGGDLSSPVLSPDGRRVAFEARGRLWVQSLDEWEPRELPGTEEGRAPFWSPQSDWVGFFRDDSLIKVPAQGGAGVTLCMLTTPQSPFLVGAWTEEGSILFTQGFGPPHRVSALGGEPREAFPVPEEYHGFRYLQALPGGVGLLVVALRRNAGSDTLGVLNSSGLEVLLQTPGVRIGRAVYSPTGHVVFARLGESESIWALPFSLSRLRATGEPFIVAPGRWPSVADDGTLALVGASTAVPRQLVWFSREGAVTEVLAPPRAWRDGVSVSPDGRRVAAADTDGIWVYDAATGSRSRLTVGDQDSSPVWIGPLGDRLAFVRATDRETALRIRSFDGGEEEREVVRHARAPTASADGRFLVFNLFRLPAAGAVNSAASRPSWEPAWVDLHESDDVHRLGDAHMGGRFPEISPDGRFLLYVSNETGQDEVFLTRFPGGQGKWQVSTDGGGWQKWGPGGNEIFYRSRARQLMAVSVNLGDSVSIGTSRVLFDWDGTWANYYGFAPDGRGLTAVPVERVREVPSIRVVRNWVAEFSHSR